MASVDEKLTNKLLYLDICTQCHAVWFDTDESGGLPSKPAPKPEKPLSDKARQTLLEAELEMNREIYSNGNEEPSSPVRHFFWVLGLTPIESDTDSEKIPYFTWILAILIGLLSIIAIVSLRENVWQLGFLPSKLFSYMCIPVLSSFFIHLRIYQLILNIIVLLAIGDSLEQDIGWKKMTGLLFASHFAGLFLYLLIFPDISTPYLGANSGIAGLLAYKAIVDPGARYSLFPPIAGHYYNMRWHKMQVNSSFLLAFYFISQITIAVNWRTAIYEVWHPDHWFYMSFITIAGIIVGLFAGFWRRAGENEKRNKAPLEIKSDIP
jgi:membrane associated rhomboid family serine protease